MIMPWLWIGQADMLSFPGNLSRDGGLANAAASSASGMFPPETPASGDSFPEASFSLATMSSSDTLAAHGSKPIPGDAPPPKLELSNLVAGILKDQQKDFSNTILSAISSGVDDMVTTTLAAATQLIDEKIDSLGESVDNCNKKDDRMEGKLDHFLKKCVNYVFKNVL